MRESSVSVAGAPGVLLVQLGTPDSPRVADVRRYLREFLSDPRVVDLPALPRRLLVDLVTLGRRPHRSAAAYRSIWMPEGSPLRVHSEALAEGLRARLGARVAGVELGMRYGRPGIAAAVERLLDAGAARLVVLPLFPQYSEAAWASAVAAVFEALGRRAGMPAVRVVPPFYDHPAWLGAVAARARPVLAAVRPDRVLISFHGIPERHVRRTDRDPRGHCLASAACCAHIEGRNRFCYRAQCFATARGLAEHLGLGEDDYEIAFQSRLGRTPWLRPFTDERLRALPRAGVARLVVISPSFVADCLETLEELGIRGRADFTAAGGTEFGLVPCPNAGGDWVDGVAALCFDHLAPTAAAPV